MHMRASPIMPAFKAFVTMPLAFRMISYSGVSSRTSRGKGGMNP